LVIFEPEEVRVVEGHAEQEWIIQETVKRATFCWYFRVRYLKSAEKFEPVTRFLDGGSTPICKARARKDIAVNVLQLLMEECSGFPLCLPPSKEEY
jgi:hypothetical protein